MHARSFRFSWILALGACALVACAAPRTPKAPAAEAPRPHPEISWDKALGVHVLVGAPDHFLHDGRYVRYAGDGWETADDWSGPWRKASPAEVPARLKRRYAKGGSTTGDVPARGSW